MAYERNNVKIFRDWGGECGCFRRGPRLWQEEIFLSLCCEIRVPGIR